MDNRKHKLPVTFLIVCIIGILGFKDTGVFVKDYVAVTNEKSISFKKGEDINIARESTSDYTVVKNGESHIVPKDSLMRTSESNGEFEVVNPMVAILDSPDGTAIAFLNQGDKVKGNQYNSEFAYINMNGIQGYVSLRNLKKSIVRSTNIGISQVNKVLKNGNNVYVLLPGEQVPIKDFKDNLYIIEENGVEFKASLSDIELSRTRDKVSRGGTSSTRVSSINKVVKSAYDALGRPYVTGDTGNRGFDCSGLVYSVYLNNLNIKLPRTSSSQASAGVHVDKKDLIPGDLIFFRTSGKNISHVGLYVGNNMMIHASTGQRKIILTDINSSYYKTRYVTSRRIIK